MRKIQGYGWKKDHLDARDHKVAMPWWWQRIVVPAVVDWTQYMPPVYDQGRLGSCTGNAVAACVEYALIKQKATVFIPSRLFIYYNERVLEGSVNDDAGAEIRDGIKAVSQWGVCPETDWPYDVSKFAVKPSDKAYQDATKDVVTNYKSVPQNLGAMQVVLAGGYPIVFGFTVYESFESQYVASTGNVPMPGANEQPIGGHAVVLVGYDAHQKIFHVRNSWGSSWGNKGYFQMPFAYVTNPQLAADFWAINHLN